MGYRELSRMEESRRGLMVVVTAWPNARGERHLAHLNQPCHLG